LLKFYSFYYTETQITQITYNFTIKDETDCIVVAGGNATLNEVISGLLNRELPASGRMPPLAVIPIGQTNTFAQKWYNILGMKHSNEAEIRLLASSAMAIIRGETIDADVIKVDLFSSI
jgi:diacylglycerol kinase family enzyme